MIQRVDNSVPDSSHGSQAESGRPGLQQVSIDFSKYKGIIDLIIRKLVGFPFTDIIFNPNTRTMAFMVSGDIEADEIIKKIKDSLDLEKQKGPISIEIADLSFNNSPPQIHTLTSF